MKIDAHQHFWNYDPKEYPWITDALRKIRQDFLPTDLQRELAQVNLDGSVAVQARQTVEETRWLLNLADQNPAIKGVVGWIDLRSDQASEQLAEFARHPRFLGVRHVVQDEPDDRFLLRPDFQRGLEKLKGFKLTYDLLIYPKQLPAAIELVRRFPEQPFVLDHIAKPFIKAGTLSPWNTHIQELAQSKNVFCKVSGLVTEADWDQWKPSDFRPYLDVVFAAFGEDRLMFGSDWPVCLLAGSYGQVIGIVQNYLEQFSSETWRKVLGDNAVKFYRLNVT
jgi:L-fuconolactonase